MFDELLSLLPSFSVLFDHTARSESVFLIPFVAMEMPLLSHTWHYDGSAGLKMRHTSAVRVWWLQQICNDKPLIYEGPNLHTPKSMGDLPLTTVSAAGLCTETTK